MNTVRQNGEAPGSPKSHSFASLSTRLRENGYAAIPVNGKKPCVAGWPVYTTEVPTREQTEQWSLQFPDANVGFTCGKLVAIDIDILEPEKAELAEQLARKHLGDTPLKRVGQHPKLALFYQTKERISGIKRHPIEVLGLGNQVVAHGIHPGTGKPYSWPDKSPEEVKRDDLPEITSIQIEDFLGACWFEGLIPTSEAVDRPKRQKPPAHPVRYYERTLSQACEQIATAREGKRNKTLSEKAGILLRMCEAGTGSPDEVRDRLRASAETAGLESREIEATLNSAARHAYNDPLWDPEPTQQDASPHFKLLSLEELWELKPPGMLVEGMIPENAITVLYGQPGHGKSFLALDFALSVATAMSWNDHGVKKGDVVYISAEGHSGMRKRIKLWLEKRNVKQPKGFFCLNEAPDLLDPETPRKLIDSIRQKSERPRLIVIDTLARCFGSGDENLTKDMTRLIANLDKLRGAFPDCTNLVVHHAGKDSSKGDRGSSALRGAADTMMCLKKTGNGLVLTCEKQKDAEPFESIRLRLVPHELANGESSCTVELDKGFREGTLNTDLPRTPASHEKVIAALTNAGNPQRFGELWKSTGMSKETLSKALKALQGARKVLKIDERYILANSADTSAGVLNVG
jgi:AAA domain/Bifunctional DNA primase/polymerase, N-terminal